MQLFKAVQDNKPFIMNVYHSVSREQVENYLYKVTYDLLEGVVEEQAQGMSVRDEDKAFIATVYKYAFVGLMLDWIKNDMKGDPQLLVDRLRFHQKRQNDKNFYSFSGGDKFLITARFLLIVLFAKLRYAFTIERKTYR